MMKLRCVESADDLENDCVSNLLLGLGILLLGTWLCGSYLSIPILHVWQSFQTSDVPVVAEVYDMRKGERDRIRYMEVRFTYHHRPYRLSTDETRLFMNCRTLEFKGDRGVLLYVNERFPEKSVLERRTDILTTFACALFFLVWSFGTVHGVVFAVKGILGVSLLIKRA